MAEPADVVSRSAKSVTAHSVSEGEDENPDDKVADRRDGSTD